MRGNNSWLLPNARISLTDNYDSSSFFRHQKKQMQDKSILLLFITVEMRWVFLPQLALFYKVLCWREMRVLTCCEIPKLSLSQAPCERAAFWKDPTTKRPLLFSMMPLPLLDVIPRAKSWLCAPTFKCCYLTVKGRENHRIIEAASNCWRSYDPYGDNMSVHPFFLKKHNLSHQDARPPYKLLKLLVNFKQVCQCRAQKDT